MNKFTSMLAGTAIGAAVMYFSDSEQGARRRAMLRDQATRARNRVRDRANATMSDLRNRTQGFRATPRAAMEEEEMPSDTTLNERVDAALGRATSHPGAINVSARNGVITLAGPILADEVPLVIDCVLNVRGVRDVVNRLDVHRDPGNVPALQGGASVRGRLRAGWQANWSPTARVAAGVAGAAAGVFGLAGGGIARKAVGLAGFGVLASAATNLPIRALAGMGGRRGITVQKTIRMNAPIERVFEIWARGENFPHFMTHAQEVRRLGDGRDARWHWKVRGMSGMEFEFDSRITAYEENRFIAWRTEPGAWVQHAGSVRFTPNSDGTTTAQVRMEYQPVAGAVGHVIAKLLGDDPKRQLDDDLMRMKAFVETGKAARDAAAPRPAL